MRVSRLLPVVAAGALVAATMAPASADTTGVGSTTGSLTALAVDAGGLLSLDLLSDVGAAGTDPADGVPSAAAALVGLAIEQPTTGISETLSVFDVSSTGAHESAGQETSVPLENPLVSGSVLPTLLGAGVGADGAVSGVASGVGDLSVLGGLLSLASSSSDLGSAVTSVGAQGERQLAIDAVTLLDLESLLAGIGIPLTDLPTDTVLGLVDALGITALDPVLAELDAALAELGLTDLSLTEVIDSAPTLLTDLTAEQTSLEALEDSLTQAGELCETATTGPVLDPLLGTIGDAVGEVVDCSDTTALLTETTAELATVIDQLLALDELLALVPGLLQDALDLLADQALVSLQGLDLSVLTRSTGDVATSVADVTATLGAINVGEISVPVGDLLGTGAQLDAVVGQVQGLVDGVLATVGLGLADLVDVGLLEEQTSVTQAEDGSVTSRAAFNGVRVDVLPVAGDLAATLEGILAGLGGVDSIGAQLEDLGLPVPDPLAVIPLDSVLGAVPVADLSGLLAGTAVLELVDGVSLRTAGLEQESTYVLSATATPGAPAAPAGPSLPRTGSNDGLVLLFGGLAAAAALGIRRWVS